MVAEAGLTMAAGRQTTQVLLALVLAVGAYILLVEQRRPSVAEAQAEARRAVRFDAASVRRVAVLAGSQEVTAERAGNVWSLVRPVAARADAGEIQKLIEALSDLERSGFITARERRQRRLDDAVYGLDLPRARVVLETADGPVVLRIGGDVPVGGQLFLQREGAEDVVVVSTNLLERLPRAAADWRDRRLLQSPPGALARLEVRRADGFVHLTREPGDGWRLRKPVAGRADEAAVEDWLRRLFAVRIEEFVADSVVGAALYGLDEPQAQVVLSGAQADGEQVLVIGRDASDQPGRVYAAIRGIEAVYSVSNSVLDILRKPLGDLRDRRLLPWAPAALRHIELVMGRDRVTLVNTNGASNGNGWELAGPRRQPAEDAILWSMVSSWAGARITTFHDDQQTNLTAWGLAQPLATLTFATTATPSSNAWAAGEAKSILLGRPTPTSGVYALEQGGSSVWEIPAAVLAATRAEERYFRSRVAFPLATGEVLSVSVQAGERVVNWQRSATNADSWVVQPAQRLAREVAESWVETAGRLRAVEWLADDPVDLAPYGLDRPTALVTVGLTGESGLAKVLLIGGPAGPDRVHALVKGQDAVFALAESDRDKLLAPLYDAGPRHDGSNGRKPTEPATP